MLVEDHSFKYSINPRPTQMYHNLQEAYWLNGMNKDITKFVTKCPSYQQVKVEHQRPEGMLQDIGML